MESFDAIVRFLIQHTHMDIPYAIDRANPLFAAIVSPMYQQIDPHELGEMARYLAEIEEYAIRVMRRWGYADKSEEDVRMMVRRLVWAYPSHGFVIDAKEAQDIGLNVEVLDDESQEFCMKLLEYAEPLVWFALPDIDTEKDMPNSGVVRIGDNMNTDEGDGCEELAE